EKARAISGAGELGTDTDVPHDAGRELVAQAKLRADNIGLATMDRLLGKNVRHERGTRELRCPDGITTTEHELVAAVPLAMARVGQELVAPVEVQAQPLERLGDDSFDVDGEAAAVDSGWRVHAQLHPEGGDAECLLVEVVKRAHPDVARLR